MDSTGSKLFNNALIAADEWYKAEFRVSPTHSHGTHSGHPEPPNANLTGDRIYNNGRYSDLQSPWVLPDGHGSPMLEPQVATTVSVNADMTIQNDARSPGEPISDGESEPILPVKCDEPSLHGKLIENLPHKCSEHLTVNPSGRNIYTKKIGCGFPDCKKTFKKASGFERHYRTVHIRAANQKFDCTIEGCSRAGEEGFSRKDNLIQHMRSVHGEEIPKNLVRFNGRSYWRWVVKGASTQGPVSEGS